MWTESMATIKVHKPDLHKDCSREPWCWDSLPGDTSALLLLSSETGRSEYSTKQMATYHSTKLEGLESWPGWVDRLLGRLVQRHLLVHHEDVVHVELQRVQTPCIVGVGCICICKQKPTRSSSWWRTRSRRRCSSSCWGRSWSSWTTCFGCSSGRSSSHPGIELQDLSAPGK